ncbi:hypothetical protein ElyMa_005257500 [Elysia marginata]|uniref:Uncharacterized protein n=1 Tax=Elysia marginata TaxID=1093978 RepID=A0AAV4K030_9GAST|nr:hypothetical protein ElyMa_005257500 [Elysia marginata]
MATEQPKRLTPIWYSVSPIQHKANLQKKNNNKAASAVVVVIVVVVVVVVVVGVEVVIVVVVVVVKVVLVVVVVEVVIVVVLVEVVVADKILLTFTKTGNILPGSEISPTDFLLTSRKITKGLLLI